MQALSQARFRLHPRQGMDWQSGVWWKPLAIFVVTAVVAVALKPLLDGEVSSGLIFVLGITLVGAISGLTPALVAAFLSSAIFNFFLADPVLTFRMSTGEDLAPPLIFTACALVSGLLAGRLKDKTLQLVQTNLQLVSLLETSRMLQTAADIAAIEAVLIGTVPGRLGFRLSIYGLKDGKAQPFAASDRRADRLALAERVMAGDAVARETVVSDGASMAFRLDGSRSCVGALVMECAGGARLDPAFSEALASLVGLALERAMFASLIAESEANVRTEELKSTLLSSVSHDLRTPLTTISASASSLIEFGSRLDSETSRNLLQGIVDECERLNRFTANLLELSRLQSGGTGIAGQILPVNDVVRSVVQRLRARSPDREISLSVGAHDILVKADTALFELALTNVIQNSLLYGDSESPVLVQSDADRNFCVIRITDQGRGIPQSEQQRVFERFYRLKRDGASPQGSGLGLAIAKGFVEAFDGSIELTSPVIGGRGTTVTIRLPVVDETLP